MTESASASVIAQSGEQDFIDGFLLTAASTFNNAAAGEPAPFDHSYGNDFSTAMSVSWQVSYATDLYTGATFTLGILDHDSQASGSQLASFAIDGHDLTALRDARFESAGGRQGENNIYSITLPGAVLADLADGNATFQLTLKAPGLIGTTLEPEESSGNAAGLDFARLTLVVPEPGVAVLTSLGGVALFRRARRTR